MQENNTLFNGSKGAGIAYSMLMILFILTAFLGQAVLRAFVTQTSTVFFVVNSLFSVISIVIVILIFIKLSKQRFFVTTYVRKFNPVYLVSSVIFSAGMFFGAGFINDLIGQGLASIGANVNDTNLPLNSVWHYIVFSVTLALLPAIIEELFFRGLLISSLKNTTRILSWLVVAFLFALFHCSLTQFVYQLIYGFGLCFLCERAESSVPCMVSHFINNFAVITLTYFNVNINLFNPIVIIIGVLALVVFVVFTLFIEIKKKPIKSIVSSSGNYTVSAKEARKELLHAIIFSLVGVALALTMLITNLVV